MSSEPPLSGRAAGASSFFTAILSPSSLPSARRCTALAKVCSSSLHCGKSTRSMLVCSVSANVLLKWSHYVITDGGDQPNVVPSRASVWYFFRELDFENIKKNYDIGNKTADAAAMMPDTKVTRKVIGTAAPRHCSGRRCSRRKSQPMFISSTARRALRPRHGAFAACADSPSNVYSTEMRPLDRGGGPQAVRMLSPTCVNNTASTSLNMPPRTKKAL